MLTLYQAEWCPHSRRVRRRLTELGIDYVNRQVPARRIERIALLDATGFDSIPVLVAENGAVVAGAESILAFLGEHYVEPAGAEAHRARAEELRRADTKAVLDAVVARVARTSA